MGKISFKTCQRGEVIPPPRFRSNKVDLILFWVILFGEEECCAISTAGWRQQVFGYFLIYKKITNEWSNLLIYVQTNMEMKYMR